MDVLESGSERTALAAERARSAARRVPPSVVLVAASAVLVAGVIGAGSVQRAELRAADVSTVGLSLVVEVSRRAGDGSTYGFARLEVTDAGGRAVDLVAVDVDVPGLRLGRAGVSLDELAPAPQVVLPVRFAVPDCAELVLPGALSARVARPGRPAGTVHAVVDDAGPGAGGQAARALRAACGVAAPDR